MKCERPDCGGEAAYVVEFPSGSHLLVCAPHARPLKKLADTLGNHVIVRLTPVELYEAFVPREGSAL